MNDHTFIPVPAGEWHTYRRDDHLSAHCPLHGTIVNPTVAWSIGVGGTQQQVIAVPSDAMQGPPDLLLCYGGVIHRVTARGEQRWRSAALGIQGITVVVDIDGDGRWEIVASNGVEVFLLLLDDGAILWRRRFGPPEIYGVYASTLRVHRFLTDRPGAQLIVPALHHRSLWCFDFSRGAEHGSLLHMLEMGDAFHPTVVIGDVDRDGVDEIVVTRLGSVAVFDMRSGGTRSLSTWETDGARRRGYGQIMLADVDGDGELELVILARQVTRHIAVLDNDGCCGFVPLWDRFIEHIYPTDHTDLRYCLNAVCDVDNDGAVEIIASIFDEHDDHRWRTEILDAQSGETKLILPDAVVCDIRDVDTDGSVEILTSQSHSRIVSENATVTIQRVHGAALETVWSRENTRYAHRTVGQTTSIGKYRPALFEHDAVWIDDRGWYVFDGEDRLLHVDAHTQSEQILFAPPKESSSCVPLIAAMADDRLIVGDRAGGVTIISNDAHPIVFRCGVSLATDGHPVERPSPTPVVFSTPDGKRFLAIPDIGDTIGLYECHGVGAPTLKWRVPGRGRIGYDRTHHSVSVADINNDGVLEILFAIPGEHSILVAMSIDEEIVARFDLPMYPAITVGARTGCYDWLVFREEARVRVLVSCYAAESMNTEESLVIDAASGAIVWKKKIIGEEFEGVGFGAWGIASADTHIAYFCAKGYLCMVDLRTGELVCPIITLTDLTRQAMIDAGTYIDGGVATLVTKDDPFTAYGSVILNDIDGDGALELIIMGSLSGFGVLNADGTTRWWKSAPLTDVAYRLGGVCDVDGDGTLELGVGHSNGDFVCYGAGTGEERWRIALGPTTIDCATCDIDGDGIDEFICRTTDGRLLAIGTDSQHAPLVKWETHFEYAVGNAVICDVDGDGCSEVLAVVGDGTLRCVR